jgi:hypothetical protein
MPRLDSQTPARISNLDYNAIRTKVDSVLGVGTGQRGYGQTVSSTPVFEGNTVSKLQWDLLRFDIVNIKVHQDGVVPPVAVPEERSVIRFGAGHPNENYDIIAEQSIISKFNIGTGQSVTSIAASQTRTGNWSSQSQCVLTVTFPDANRARYFFNSGGKLRFLSSRTGGSSSSQNTSWTNLLNSIGTKEFSATITSAVNFYNLTTSYRPLFEESPTASSAAYVGNSYRIDVKCNCTGANNSTGTASVVEFRFTWADAYTDPGPTGPGDLVDGTLSIRTDEFKAVGPMLPSGTFTIQSPTYSFSSISSS